MIPVLHPADSTSWSSFGLGALSDAIKCEVMEERNGQYELEMTYPVSGQHYSDLALRMIILAKPNFNDPPQPFRIYEISRPLNGIVTVSAQHLSYDLSGYVDSAFSAVGVQSALVAMTANCTPYPCPFSFYSDMSSTGTMDVRKPTSIRALMGGSEGSLIDHWHGEWSYNGYTCRFDVSRGTDRGVTIRYGKNLTSLKQEENNAAVYTGIYPFWFNQDTKVLVTLPEKTISVPGTFSFTKVCPVDLSDKFEEAPTEEQLRSAAQSYISSHDIGVPDVNLELGFVQLEEIQERVDLCDTVHVYFDELGVSAAAKCVRTRWNVLSEQYIKIELGSIRASIASTITGIKETADQAYTATSTLADTARTVSERITGQLGGYVVMQDTDNDGEPDEILIMDAADKEEAVNVIRMNNSGIAFSQDGYHGTYGTAWSIDGQFVADYITSGVLQANLIRILGTTNFYWDAGNIYIINPNDSGQQIRIGQYDGTRYGIGFTRDGGVTWQTAMDFQGLNVSATGFSKTYVSLTPPDPGEYDLNIGDIWVESDRRYSWDEVSENTWSWAAQHTWQDLGGVTDPNMYTWNGGSWQLIYDGESFTSFDTRLTLAEQEIAMAVASVASKGVTYIQLTDPRNDSGVTVNMGDHWIKAEPGYQVITWHKASLMSWNTFASTYTWDGTEGPKEYAWDGYSWILVSDQGAEVRNRTAIIETDKKITLMAQAQTTMNHQLIENTAQLTVQANRIATEVAQRIAGETQMASRITQNAQAIEMEVVRAETAEGTKYTIRSGIAITANGIEITASKKLTLDSGCVIEIKSGADINVKSGGEITVESGGDFNVNSGGDILIKSGGTLTINSGGKFVITSTNFNIDSNGNVSMTGAITSTSGTIGGWTIGANTLYSGSGSNLIALNNSNPGTSGQPVIYAGGEGGNAPFYVTRGGELHATSATIKGVITVDRIDFSNGVTMNASNLTDGSIGGVKIANSAVSDVKIASGAVSKGKTSSGVQQSLDNGDSALSSFQSLTSGSISASYIKTDKLWIGAGKLHYNDHTYSESYVKIGTTNYYILTA